MTIAELIKNKDYDYISYRLIEKGKMSFVGRFFSKNGEIISLNGDIYNKDKKVIFFEEWSQPEDNIQNGLTIIVDIS